ncbi:zeatin O-glucosyltransferase-like [Apium graveolens]|uniref:zeatin O-glucosyltransferase-like n=1 Tax=Apium graveolens TaxID=4045 RepID=UPI003D792F06
MAGQGRQANENDKNVVVVMVPFPAQGHLNQLLHLSRLISSYDIHVHYVGTITHCRQAKIRVHGWNPVFTSHMIHFHEVPTPAFSSPPPNPHASLKFPSHLQPSFDAALLLREPVAALVSLLSPTARRVIVIHDSFIPSIIQDVVSIPNVKAYSFQPVSTFLIACYYSEIVGKPLAIDDDVARKLPRRGTTMTSEMMQLVNRQKRHHKYSSGVLFDTCRAIEAPFLDVLAKVNAKQWAIGPFNPVEVCNKSTDQRHNCLEWLDNQAPDSVIYVSFGTTTTLTNEQIHALASGLEKSDQKFVWVLRDADKGDIFTGNTRVCQLPKGYEERIKAKGQGKILRDWAPQLEILAHVSTGGFMSHCGWNSCMESMTMGVPMATWPMHSDQPHNALLVTEVLKIGVVVKDWTLCNELVESQTIEKAVKELMASEEGEKIRKRAMELGTAVKRSVAEGGDTHREFDDFIEHICRFHHRSHL